MRLLIAILWVPALIVAWVVLSLVDLSRPEW